jgi:hypothetical protein
VRSDRWLEGLGWVVIGALVVLWLTETAILVAGQGNAELMLSRWFRGHARSDTFAHIDQSLGVVWGTQTALTILALAALRSRRGDVLYVLLIGPVLVVIGCAVTEKWSDPDCFVIAAVCSIGWFIGALVGGGYWFVTRRRGSTT